MIVRDLIYDALFACGAHGQGDVPSDADAQLCLRRLQRMVDSWANDNLTVYNTVAGTMSLVAGTNAYSTTLLSTGRPVTIQNAYLTRQQIDYPLTQLTEEEWNAIAYKVPQGLSSVFYYSPGHPDGTFYFYPTPSDPDVVTVNGRYPLAVGLALTTTLSLPPGYEAALCDSLAVDIAPSFGVQPSAVLTRSATMARDVLKSTNFVPGVMQTGLPGSGYSVPGYIRIRGDT